jgi:hypothetical protein
MEFLIIALMIGLIPATIAGGKGHSFFLWWVYGAALWIIAMPHSLLLSPDQQEIDRRRLGSGDGKKCLFCAEIIRADASVCRYCGREQLAT